MSLTSFAPHSKAASKPFRFGTFAFRTALLLLISKLSFKGLLIEAANHYRYLNSQGLDKRPLCEVVDKLHLVLPWSKII